MNEDLLYIDPTGIKSIIGSNGKKLYEASSDKGKTYKYIDPTDFKLFDNDWGFRYYDELGNPRGYTKWARPDGTIITPQSLEELELQYQNNRLPTDDLYRQHAYRQAYFTLSRPEFKLGTDQGLVGSHDLAKQVLLNNGYLPKGISFQRLRLAQTDAPLKGVYPEFYVLTGGKALANGAFNFLAPGSQFWKNFGAPILRGEAVNAGLQAATGKTWGLNLSSSIEGLAGYRPSEVITEMTNPFFYTSGGIDRAIGTIGSTVEQGLNRGLNQATKAYTRRFGSLGPVKVDSNPDILSLYNGAHTTNYTEMLLPKHSTTYFTRTNPNLSFAEYQGIPKRERNFVPKWTVANYPGYLLKGLMKGSPLERQLSKNGTININQLNAYFNKASQIEREVANKVLSEKFAGLKTIDYNQFKKAVLDELITYSTKPQMKFSTYGMKRLGFNVIEEPDGAGGILEYLPGVRTNTFTFESPRLPVGSNKHYDPTTLGHSRTYTTLDEPNILHVIESLSDWGQSYVKMIPSVLANQIAIKKALKSGNINAFHSFTNRLSSLMRDKLTKYERMALENINKEIEYRQSTGLTFEDLLNKKYEILKKAGNRNNIGVLGQHLHDNYLLRQLQENLRYAAENGLTKMRYPTPETAAKIEGYLKTRVNHTPEAKSVLDDLNKSLFTNEKIKDSPDNFLIPDYFKMRGVKLSKQTEDLLLLYRLLAEPLLDYRPEYKTILKKYADFPKLFLKLFKGYKVRTVTDPKGNTWYEVDVPKNYLNREWQFKKGGKLKSRLKLKIN